MRTHCIKFSWVPFTGSHETVFLLLAAIKLGSPQNTWVAVVRGALCTPRKRNDRHSHTTRQDGACCYTVTNTQGDLARRGICTVQHLGWIKILFVQWWVGLITMYAHHWVFFVFLCLWHNNRVVEAFKTRSSYKNGEAHIAFTHVPTCPVSYLVYTV